MAIPPCTLPSPWPLTSFASRPTARSARLYGVEISTFERSAVKRLPGRPPKYPVRVPVWISQATHDGITTQAAQLGLSQSGWVREVINAALTERGQPAKEEQHG